MKVSADWCVRKSAIGWSGKASFSLSLCAFAHAMAAAEHTFLLWPLSYLSLCSTIKALSACNAATEIEIEIDSMQATKPTTHASFEFVLS